MASATITAGTSLACWAAISFQPSLRAAKHSLTGLLVEPGADPGV
jgi:hypothetical protein